jgi:hypothetical protein
VEDEGRGQTWQNISDGKFGGSIGAVAVARAMPTSSTSAAASRRGAAT